MCGDADRMKTKRLPTPIWPTALCLLLPLLLMPAAHAADADSQTESSSAPEAAPRWRYVLGAGLRWQPEAAGARRMETKFTPLWAVQWGRWRLSTPGGNGLLGFGEEAVGPGASTDLFKGQRLRLGVALRFDNGRDSGSASTTSGLSDVKRTVRGRLYSSYAITSDWQVSGYLSQDLLGHQGGAMLGLDLGWRLRQSRHSEWTAGVGLGAADGVYMRSYFGVTPAGALATGLTPYRPAAGLGYTHALTQRWIVYANAGGSYLLGPAADSPLTQRRFGGQIGAGFAYRN